jgi:hypothetical protein
MVQIHWDSVVCNFRTPAYSEPAENGPDTHITLYSCHSVHFFISVKLSFTDPVNNSLAVAWGF